MHNFSALTTFDIPIKVFLLFLKKKLDFVGVICHFKNLFT